MTPRSTLALAMLLAAGSVSAQPVSPSPAAAPGRAELEGLRTALESAIDRAGRIRLAAGARTAGRVYRLKGYGAVIVLAPRALPAARFVMRRRGPEAPGAATAAGSAGPRVVITMPQGTFDVGMIDLGELEREMEVQMAAQAAALRDMESAQREWSRAREEEVRQHLRLVEQQAEAFRLEAERARRKAEREVRTRLAPPPPAAPGAAAAPSAPAAPAAPIAPPAPPAPAVAVSPVSGELPWAPEIPLPPELPEAPPPWRFWFDVTDGSDLPEAADTPDAEALVMALRERLVAGLDAYRRPLTFLRPDDFVTVALDLVPDLLPRARPTRTLLLRVRAGDLQDRRTGRLTAAELRKRVEFEEN
jgi:hypothetical protein